MTDKQIIIDGICVSNCEHYDNVCLGNHHYKYCKDNENCYYKQLKRAEAQCEAMFVSHTDLEKKYKAKEQECEELKSLLKVRIEDLCDSCGASSMMPMPCKVYEKALTEIKELLKDICIEECCFDWNKTNKKHCGDCDCRFMQLLEKISECEGNNE